MTPRRRKKLDQVKSAIAKIEHGLAVARCIRELIGPDKRGTPKRVWVNMTPTRYGHATEMARERKYSPRVLHDAVNTINASAWLKKRVGHVTEGDIDQLFIDKPWEKKPVTKNSV